MVDDDAQEVEVSEDVRGSRAMGRCTVGALNVLCLSQIGNVTRGEAGREVMDPPSNHPS